jgi:hypothetical protein
MGALERSPRKETVMCQFSHIRLSSAEREEVKKLSGVMIPIYASVALVLLAVVVAIHVPQSDSTIAIVKNNPPPADFTPSR